MAALGIGDGAGVGGEFGGVGAFQLRGLGEHQERDAAHACVGGVDRQRVGQRPYADAAAGDVVDEIQDLAPVAAPPVEDVHDDRVPGPGVPQQLGQSFAIDGGYTVS